MFKKLLMVSALLMLMAGFAMIPQGKAHALALDSLCQTSPSHTNCDGLDPHQTGCDSSASPVLSVPLIDNHNQNDGTLYIEWSSRCFTNWGRLVMKHNGTDPWCVVSPANECWAYMSARMFLLNFNSNGTYNSETYLPLSQGGLDYCTNNCGGSTLFYGNMYYAPVAEVAVGSYDVSEYNATDGNPVVASACLYTGASWRYASNKPTC